MFLRLPILQRQSSKPIGEIGNFLPASHEDTANRLRFLQGSSKGSSAIAVREKREIKRSTSGPYFMGLDLTGSPKIDEFQNQPPPVPTT